MRVNCIYFSFQKCADGNLGKFDSTECPNTQVSIAEDIYQRFTGRSLSECWGKFLI